MVSRNSSCALARFACAFPAFSVQINRISFKLDAYTLVDSRSDFHIAAAFFYAPDRNTFPNHALPRNVYEVHVHGSLGVLADIGFRLKTESNKKHRALCSAIPVLQVYMLNYSRCIPTN